MTFGQRVAQKRKELGLSQEGLGEQLGVSRQAIYKWESDAAMPEIDKLITLSKIFSVPVGWLLGVEEDGPPQQREDPGELTDAQLQMVREIVDGYLAAQPKPMSRRRKGILRAGLGLAAVCLVITLFNLFSTLDRVNMDYRNLRQAMDDVNRNVDRQIVSVTDRVERILKSQNDLTAEWDTELVSTDPKAGTAAFDIRVVPKTYVEGMTAVFTARCQAPAGETTVELPVEPGEDHAFTGRIVCPITDEISLTVVFVTGDRRETQWLEDYYDLYYSSFPSLTMRDELWYSLRDVKDNILPPTDGSGDPVVVWNNDLDEPLSFQGWNPDPPARLQVGLFRDQKLVTWYEGRNFSSSWNGVPTEAYGWYRPGEITLEPGVYCEAAVYTDEYGRQMISPGSCEIYPEPEGPSSSASAAVYSGPTDPSGWEF